MRAFGNSKRFPYRTLTRDFSAAGDLADCSLLYFEIEDDAILDIINSFTFENLIFSRMAGDTSTINPTACLISKHDILHCYEFYQRGLL